MTQRFQTNKQKCPHCLQDTHIGTNECLFCGSLLPSTNSRRLFARKVEVIMCPACRKIMDISAESCVFCGHHFDKKINEQRIENLPEVQRCPDCHNEINLITKVCLLCKKSINIENTLKPAQIQPNRRNCDRTKAETGSLAPIKMIVSNPDFDELFEAEVVNISAMGVKLKTRKMLCKFTSYHFEFIVQETVSFKLIGEVIYLKKVADGYETGIKYTELENISQRDC